MLETLRIPLLLVLAAALFLQVLLGNQRLSVTYDEITFIPTGYSYFATGDFRLNEIFRRRLRKTALIPN